MHVTIVGRHIAVTPALRRYVEDRLMRLERFGAKSAEAQVVLSVEKFRHSAEVVLNVSGAVLQGKVATNEMYASVDQVTDRIRRQLLKRKERRVDHKPRGGRRQAASPAEEAAPTYVVARPKLPVLTPREAVDRLSPHLGAHLLFSDAATARVQLLWRRDDGQIELVDPQRGRA